MKVSGLLFAIGALAYYVSGTGGWVHGPGAMLIPVGAHCLDTWDYPRNSPFSQGQREHDGSLK